jgi:hypothetical protein
MNELILAALSHDEVVEILRDAVLLKNSMDPAEWKNRVMTKLSYSTRGGNFVCAVAISQIPQARAPEQAG